MIKIVSGGQTGVDRAALDIAIKLNIPHGGWCPRNRLSEDGVIPAKYQLAETKSSEYSERTKLNIQDSDGTLIIVPKIDIKITDGTILTIQEAQYTGKPHLIVNISEQIDTLSIIRWTNENNINILNIAGPRESQCPGIYVKSCKVIEHIIKAVISYNNINSTDDLGYENNIRPKL